VAADISAASTRRTYVFKTTIAEFQYRAIKPDLFFGYDLVNYNDKYIKIASMEKATLDYFYLNPHLKRRADFASLRINRDMFFEQVNEERMYEFIDRFAKKAIIKRMESFLEFMKDA